MQLLVRFLIGGAVVLIFALLGDVLRPRSFAGIFGAAPSVALATLVLTVRTDGPQYAAIEARSMIIGAFALAAYAWAASRAMWKLRAPVSVVAIFGLLLWLGSALAGLFFLLRVPP